MAWLVAFVAIVGWIVVGAVAYEHGLEVGRLKERLRWLDDDDPGGGEVVFVPDQLNVVALRGPER